MSIQPNRVIARIVEQVDQSDWPTLPSRLISSPCGSETLRVYRSLADARYATPIHFWVHALRDELAATERRADLVGAAGHAMGRNQSLDEWLGEVGPFFGPAVSGPDSKDLMERAAEVLLANEWPIEFDSIQVYRMLESECRRSSVLDGRHSLHAFFWVHGAAPSWRRRSRC